MTLKKLIPNKEYIIDVDSEELAIYRVDRYPVDLKVKDDEILIELYGITKWVKKEWLRRLADAGCWLPDKYRHLIFDLKIDLLEYNKFTFKEKYAVTIDNPIYIDRHKHYRLLVQYPIYAISKTGKVYNTATAEFVKPWAYHDNRTDTYIYIKIYASKFNITTGRVVLHRLVALAWVKNDDFKNKVIINHKDRNKHNCNADNLEWCTFRHNTMHGTYDKDDNNRMIVIRNINTGAVSKFPSLTLAAEYIGRSRINTVHTPLKHGYVWEGTKGEFEIKYTDDPTEWKYLDKNLGLDRKHSLIQIDIVYKDGTVKTYHRLLKVIKDYLGLDGRLSAEVTKERVLAKHTDVEDVVITRLTPVYGNVQATNISTNETFEEKTHLELAKKLGLGKSTVTKYAKLEEPYNIINNWKIVQLMA